MSILRNLFAVFRLNSSSESSLFPIVTYVNADRPEDSKEWKLEIFQSKIAMFFQF